MRRYIPQEWPIEALAKELLLQGETNRLKLCINCKYLKHTYSSSLYCEKNNINMDDYNVEACICENWSSNEFPN